jgi:hypothetical protein
MILYPHVPTKPKMIDLLGYVGKLTPVEVTQPTLLEEEEEEPPRKRKKDAGGLAGRLREVDE